MSEPPAKVRKVRQSTDLNLSCGYPQCADRTFKGQGGLTKHTNSSNQRIAFSDRREPDSTSCTPLTPCTPLAVYSSPTSQQTKQKAPDTSTPARSSPRFNKPKEVLVTFFLKSGKSDKGNGTSRMLNLQDFDLTTLRNMAAEIFPTADGRSKMADGRDIFVKVCICVVLVCCRIIGSVVRPSYLCGLLLASLSLRRCCYTHSL